MPEGSSGSSPLGLEEQLLIQYARHPETIPQSQHP